MYYIFILCNVFCTCILASPRDWVQIRSIGSRTRKKMQIRWTLFPCHLLSKICLPSTNMTCPIQLRASESPFGRKRRRHWTLQYLF